jgi:hypothetical protein
LFDPADRKGQRADRGALHEAATFERVHGMSSLTAPSMSAWS